MTRDSDRHRRLEGIMDTVAELEEEEEGIDTNRLGTRIPQDVVHRRCIITIRRHHRIIIITGIMAAAAALGHRLQEEDRDRPRFALGTRRAAVVVVESAGTLRPWDRRRDCQCIVSYPGAGDDCRPPRCEAVEAAFEHPRRFGDGLDAEKDDRLARSGRGYSRQRRCVGTS